MEEQAIERAEAECLADGEVRPRRHTETRYDELLAGGEERREAREEVEEEVLQVLVKWEGDPNSGA